VNVTRDDLLRVHEGTRTDAGLRHNVRVGVQYLEAWLGGNGCVPLYNLMEDAATAEISRAQVWQWIRYGVTTRRRQPRSPPSAPRDHRDEEMARVRARSATRASPAAASPRPAPLRALSPRRPSKSSSPSPRTPCCVDDDEGDVSNR
jgi:malate synthase